MAMIKKSTNSKCWRGCREKGTLLHCWWECKLIQPVWRTVWRFLKKLKIEPPYDPAIPLLGMYPEKTIIRKETCTTVFTAALQWKRMNICICITESLLINFFKVLESSQRTSYQKAVLRGFPGGAVIGNPPASAGDTGSSPGPGRSHMPWSN